MAINKDFLVKNGLQVGGNTQLTGSLTAAGLSYPVSDGDPYMAMVTDGNGNLSFNNVDTVESDVTNNTGSLIPKGTPVYQTGAAGNTLTIAPSDASNAATMPAIGVTGSDIANGDTGRVIHFGYIHGVDTSAFTEGDRIYVADGGGYQEGRPTGEGNVVQFLGVVTKVHATNGSGVVFGGGRAHAVPNLDDGNIFIGDNTNSPVTATLDTSIVPENSNLYFTDTRAVDAIEASTHLTIDGGTLYIDTDANRIGINDTSPSQALDVTGNIAVAGTTVIDSGAEIVTAQLKDSGVTAGSYGSASLVPIITVDAKGRITSASTTSVAGVSNFTFNNTTDVLTISTADGGSFPVDISNITVGGSMVGPLADLTVVYQSAAPSDPSQGQMWFDSLNQLMMVYTGSAWVQAVPGGGTSGGGDTTDAVATMEKYTYSISSTTNSVQGTDDNGNSLSYVVDGSQNVEVFVNGVKQAEGAAKDYVATTGTAVTFTYNLPAGTIVDVQVFELLTQDAFYLKSETYNRTETNSQISTALGDYLPLAGGTLTGNLSGTNATFTGNLTVDTNTLYVDSTNNRVGVGTTAPNEKLEVLGDIRVGVNGAASKIKFTRPANYNVGATIGYRDAATNTDFDFINTSGGGALNLMSNAGEITFGTAVDDSEMRARIKADGDIQFATTNAALYAATSGGGLLFEPHGTLTVARETTASTQPTFIVNNTGVDGDLVQFRRDGGIVGKVLGKGGMIAIGSGDTGLYFNSSTNVIHSYSIDGQAGSITNGTIDLGQDTIKFKDGWFSGEVNASEFNTSATQEKTAVIGGLAEASEYLLASISLSGESGAYVDITATLNSTGTVSAGSTIHARYSLERTYSGTVIVTKLSYTADNGGIRLRTPVINGNAVEFYFLTYNNGTATTPTVKTNVKAINANITMGTSNVATSSGASAETEGMFIDGNVGIGGNPDSSYKLRVYGSVDINSNGSLTFDSGDVRILQNGYGLETQVYDPAISGTRTKTLVTNDYDAPVVGYYKGAFTFYQARLDWALRGAGTWNRVAYIDHRCAYELVVGTHGGWYGPGHTQGVISINYSGAAFGWTKQSGYNEYWTQLRFTCAGNGSGGGFLDIYISGSYNENGPDFHIRPLDGGTYTFVDMQTLNPSTLTYSQTTSVG